MPALDSAYSSSPANISRDILGQIDFVDVERRSNATTVTVSFEITFAVPKLEDCKPVRPTGFSVAEAMNIAGITSKKGLAQARRDVAHVRGASKSKPNLQQLRLLKGLSQIDMANHLETKQSYVSRLENGEIRNPSTSRLRQLASVLGVSVETIMEAIDG